MITEAAALMLVLVRARSQGGNYQNEICVRATGPLAAVSSSKFCKNCAGLAAPASSSSQFPVCWAALHLLFMGRLATP